MKKYKYLLLTSSPDDETIRKLLNEMANDGWRVVSVQRKYLEAVCVFEKECE